MHYSHIREWVATSVFWIAYITLRNIEMRYKCNSTVKRVYATIDGFLMKQNVLIGETNVREKALINDLLMQTCKLCFEHAPPP